MKIISAKYANADGGILLTRESLPDLYVDSGDLYDRAISGEFGALGDMPEPPEPQPDPVPQTISRFQARAALHQAGYLEQVQTAIESADPIVKMAWEDATEFRRNSPTVLTFAETLGLTDEQLDEMFRTAAQIEA